MNNYFLLFVLICCALQPVRARSQSTGVGGNVVDSNGSVIRVGVLIVSESTNDSSRTITDSEGNYFITDIEPGIYVAQFEHKGVIVQIDSVEVLNNEVMTVCVKMPTIAANPIPTIITRHYYSLPIVNPRKMGCPSRLTIEQINRLPNAPLFHR